MSLDVTTLALAKSYTNQHGGGGGGSWPSDLPKPSVGGYGYTESGEQTTITWDGDTDGRVVIAGLFYKISELTPTIEEMIGGVVYTKSQNNDIFQEEITSDSIITSSEHVYGVKGYGRSMVLIALENDEIEGNIVERGMYYSKEGSGVLSVYITSLTYGTPDTVHKIDEKYLPDNLATNVAEAQTTANNAQETANKAQTTANNAKNIASKALPLSGGVIRIGSDQLATLTLDEFPGSSGTQKRGIQIGGNGAYGHPILEVTHDDITIYDRLAQRRIGGLNPTELFLTAKNSNKTFKITVDASGTLKATEVTST